MSGLLAAVLAPSRGDSDEDQISVAATWRVLFAKTIYLTQAIFVPGPGILFHMIHGI